MAEESSAGGNGGGAGGGGAGSGGAGSSGAGSSGAGSSGAGGLELRGPAVGLLDEPLVVQARGLGGVTDGVIWRARVRDDDGRIWRAVAARPHELAAAWAPAKRTAGELAALQSLRPLALEVRVEAPDGRAATRTFTRRLLADGVRVRRWREGVGATLYLPAAGTGASAAGAADAGGPATRGTVAAVVLDATAGGDVAEAVALTAALLASRGVLAFAVTPQRTDSNADPATLLAAAAHLLAQVPAAANAPGGVQQLTAPLPLPPGIPTQAGDFDARATAWDELLARLGAQPRAALAD